MLLQVSRPAGCAVSDRESLCPTDPSGTQRARGPSSRNQSAMRSARTRPRLTWVAASISVYWCSSLAAAIVTHLVTRFTLRVLVIQAALASVDGKTTEHMPSPPRTPAMIARVMRLPFPDSKWDHGRMVQGHRRPARVALLWLSSLATLAGCGGTSCLDATDGAAGPTVVLERGHLGRQPWQLVAWEQGGHLGLGLDGDSLKRQYSSSALLGSSEGGLVCRADRSWPCSHHRPNQTDAAQSRAARRPVLRYRPSRPGLRGLECDAQKRSRPNGPFYRLLG